MYKKKFFITFAGAIGSSKTPIAHYLSIKFNLPIFNNDAIRSEVIEDIGFLNNEEYIKRRDLRLKEILDSGIPFIYDASIDRAWEDKKEYIIQSQYEAYIISLDLSKELLIKLYQAKKYNESLLIIDTLIKDHNDFLEQYEDDINLHITDKDFINRINIAYYSVYVYIITLLIQN
jgi:hypothetical protein